MPDKPEDGDMPEFEIGYNLSGRKDIKDIDKLLLREIFAINQTLKDMNGKVSEALALKEMVICHEKQINGDKEKMGEGGIIYTLTTIVTKATMVASLVAFVASGIWGLVIAFMADHFTKK